MGDSSQDPFEFLDNIKKTDSTLIQKDDDHKPVECSHKHTIINNTDETVCQDCGMTLKVDIILEKDWKNFGTKGAVDQTRTSVVSRTKYKGIEDDLKHLNLQPEIQEEVIRIYNKATQHGKAPYRTYRKKALILACVSEAHKKNKTPINFDRLIEMFQPIERKHAFQGFKILALKNKHHIIYIKPIDLVGDLLSKYGIEDPKPYLESIEMLYKRIANRSSILNRSKPQSVAAGLIYYYSLAERRNIPLKEFSLNISISELTINKIAKEISSILRTPNILQYNE